MTEKTDVEKISDKPLVIDNLGVSKITAVDGAIDVAVGIKTANEELFGSHGQLPAEKRKRKYTDWKGKYFTSRGWNLIMIVFLFFMALLLASTLRGNHALQMELNTIVQAD